MVINQMTTYGPSGVPNGLVDTQNVVHGRTPCRPHSLICLESPTITEIMFPREARAIKKFRPRTAAPSPNTLEKKRLAVVSSEFASSSLGTGISLACYLPDATTGELTSSEEGDICEHV